MNTYIYIYIWKYISNCYASQVVSTWVETDSVTVYYGEVSEVRVGEDRTKALGCFPGHRGLEKSGAGSERVRE